MYAPVDDNEIADVAGLMNRAYRGNGGAGWCSEAAYLAGDRTSEALLRADREDKPAAFLLKWQDASATPIRGCVWLEPLSSGTWYLGSLAVDPLLQARGLGRVMLGAAEAWIGERGGTRVRMTVVNVRDTLIAWYRRRGYLPTGGIERFPYGDDRFGRPLRDDLEFVVLEKQLLGHRYRIGTEAPNR